jgi:hypothetical protein
MVKKVAFQVLVSVPEFVYEQTFEPLSQILGDEGLELTKEALNVPKVQEYVETMITDWLNRAPGDIDTWDLFRPNDVLALFKDELKQVKEEEKRLQEEEKRLQKEEAARERERQAEFKKTGQLLNIPAKDAERARAILIAAGIKVNLP